MKDRQRWLALAAVAIFVVTVFYLLATDKTVPTQTAKATVVSKAYEEALDKNMVTFNLDNKGQAKAELLPDLFNRLKVGDRVNLEYIDGKYTHVRFVMTVTLIKSAPPSNDAH